MVSICANAAGEYPPPLVIYAYDQIPAVYRSMLPKNWAIGCMTTGWMNGECFFEYFANCFIPNAQEKHKGEDNHIL